MKMKSIHRNEFILKKQTFNLGITDLVHFRRAHIIGFCHRPVVVCPGREVFWRDVFRDFRS